MKTYKCIACKKTTYRRRGHCDPCYEVARVGREHRNKIADKKRKAARAAAKVVCKRDLCGKPAYKRLGEKTAWCTGCVKDNETPGIITQRRVCEVCKKSIALINFARGRTGINEGRSLCCRKCALVRSKARAPRQIVRKPKFKPWYTGPINQPLVATEQPCPVRHPELRARGMGA
jgi:hypothetical protein